MRSLKNIMKGNILRYERAGFNCLKGINNNERRIL